MDIGNGSQNMPRRCVELLMECDKLILDALNIQLAEVKEGQVTLMMRVSESMVTSQDLCHGGSVFTLADLAAAYSAASVNAAPVTTEANISFIAAGKLGNTLKAIASIECQGKKTIHSNVRVVNELGEVVAIYRGSNLIRGQCMPKQSISA